MVLGKSYFHVFERVLESKDRLAMHRVTASKEMIRQYHLSDVLVPVALVSGGTHMAASGNWIFFPEASPSYFGTFLMLGNDRVDAVSVYAWFSLVSFVRDAMGTSRDSSDRSHSWSMGRILLPDCVQFVPGFLFTSPFGSPT